MDVKKLNRDNLGDVLALYNKMVETLSNKFWFKNTKTEEWEKLIADGCLFGAFLENGRLVGVSALELDKPDYEISGEFSAPNLVLGEIGYFIVDEKYRGQGILNQINLHLVEIAKSVGFNALCASIHPSNFSAIRGFSKLGKLEYAGNFRIDREYPAVVYGVKV